MKEEKQQTPQERKQAAIDALRMKLPRYRVRLAGIDARLLEYFEGLASHSSAVKGDDNDRHGYYELLGGLKFLRLLDTYGFDGRKVQQVVRLREGEWHKEGGRWVHDSGGLAQPGGKAQTFYRWEPFQVFILASVFGFRAWIDTRDAAGTRPLLPSERERDGKIYDSRRLCTDFTFYAARKNDKTGMAAFIQVVFFLLEDNNAEIYCCANAADQAKILYERTRKMLAQLDPTGQRIRQTATVCDWRPAYKGVRDSLIRPLTAGGKTKDGLIAQLCCADEYGSSPWIKGKSDMKQLVDVVESSMGPRREPLTFTTTTAGTITEGPFIEKLDGLHRLLEQELDYGTADAKGNITTPTLGGDRTLALCLEPDAWERDEEFMLTSTALRYKVCPMLGKVVQHSYYDDWVAKVRIEPSKITEFVTKNMNVYHSATAEEWITAAQIRTLQDDVRVDDCKYADGWLVFVGMDFSLGDDLHAVSYLAYNQQTRRFVADCDSWITEHALEHSPMREVFRKWITQGWLHLSPGQTLQPELPINRVAELTEKGVNLCLFLYDPYRATQPINALSAYVYSLGIDPKACIMPCRQNYATFNPLVLELDYLVKNEPPQIAFSRNPMWQWQAGNMLLDVSSDGMDNRKPRKRDQGSKIDNFICLLEALRGFDIADGREQSQQ